MSDEILPPIVGKAEAAEIFGIHPNNLRRIEGLPEPDTRLRATPVWLRSKIEACAESRTRARAAAAAE